MFKGKMLLLLALALLMVPFSIRGAEGAAGDIGIEISIDDNTLSGDITTLKGAIEAYIQALISDDTESTNQTGATIVNINSSTAVYIGDTALELPYVYVNSNDSSVTYTFSTLILNNTGTGRLTLLAENDRHFKLSGTSTLQVQYATLDGQSTGGGVEFNGYSSSNHGASTFTDVIFRNNHNDDNGGAICLVNSNNDSATIQFADASFTNNTAGGSGGAIYIASSNAAKMTFGDGSNTFTGNTAAASGGAIYISNNSPTNPNIVFDITTNASSPRFEENSAASGGAVYVSNISQLTGENSSEESFLEVGGTFVDNTATSGNGGAICIDDSNGTLNLDLSRNSFTFSSNTSLANGGAVFSMSMSTVILSGDNTFTDNTARTSGGAIYTRGPIIVSGDAHFTSNIAENGDGGAIYTSNTAASVFYDGTFSRNKAIGTSAGYGNGGAFYTLGPVTVYDGYFGGAEEASGNTAGTTNGNGRCGGAIFSGYSGEAINVYGGTFAFNHSYSTGTNTDSQGTGGGAIYAAGYVRLYGGVFSHNYAETHGGAIYSHYTTNTNSNLDAVTVSSMDFSTQNRANAGNGGAICAPSGNITASNSNFANQYANSNGGAIYTGVKAVLTNSLFTTNQAYTGFGGAVSVGYVDVTNCTFGRNFSDSSSGGAIYLGGGGNSNILYSLFDENNAQGSLGGGAIYQPTGSGGTTRVIIHGCIFNNNYANHQGGAISMGGGNNVIFRCTFENNQALIYETSPLGGAIYLNSTRARVADCTFYNNMAVSQQGGANPIRGQGGAMYIDVGVTSTNGRSSLVYNTFAENDVGEGAGGALATAGTIYMMGNLFAGNRGTYGKDIFGAAGEIHSQGYNLFTDYGQMGNAATNTMLQDVDWQSGAQLVYDYKNLDQYILSSGGFETNEIVFGKVYDFAEHSSSLTSIPEIGASFDITSVSVTRYGNTLKTLSLRISTSSTPGNPAINLVPRDYARQIFSAHFSELRSIGMTHMDERGIDRDSSSVGRIDVGAYESAVVDQGTGGGDTSVVAGLSYIRISGIPNTLTTVGQTAALLFKAYDSGGNEISVSDVPVKWSSSNTGVAVIDEDTGVIYSRGMGSTRITVTTTVSSMSGYPVSDGTWLGVTNAMSYTNVTVNVYNLQTNRNNQQQVEQDGTMLYVADVDPSLVNAAPFQSTFSQIWNGVTATQVSAGSVSAGYISSSDAPVGYQPASRGASVSMAGQSEGAILPMNYTWTYSLSELSTLLGRSVTTAPSAEDIFRVLSVGFQLNNGAYLPVVNSGVRAGAVRTAGVGATDAASGNAINVIKMNDEVIIKMTAYLANVDTSGGARMINNLLVVPDGADSSISGTMWLVRANGSSSGNASGNTTGNDNGSGGSDDGGGGGCSTVFGVGLLIPVMFLSGVKLRSSAPEPLRS